MSPACCPAAFFTALGYSRFLRNQTSSEEATSTAGVPDCVRTRNHHAHPELESVLLLLRAPGDRHNGVAELGGVLDAQVSQAAHPCFFPRQQIFIFLFFRFGFEGDVVHAWAVRGMVKRLRARGDDITA